MKYSEKQLIGIVDSTIGRYKGDSRRISNAIGYLMMDGVLGWKVTLLMHDRKSIKDYESVLQIDSRKFFPEFGPLAEKSVACRGMKKVGNFWKAVKGEIPAAAKNKIGPKLGPILFAHNHSNMCLVNGRTNEERPPAGGRYFVDCFTS